MSIETEIVGSCGPRKGKFKANVRPFDTAQGPHEGIVALTQPFQEFEFTAAPFLNPSFGNAMNQQVVFGGTPEIIHNGGTSTEWTGTAIAGTWNFADSGKITITAANDLDTASFAEETPTTIDMTGFTTLTGKVDLDTYNAVTNSITIAFDNGGTPVGNSVELDDFIDIGNFAEQSFAIAKGEFGLTTQAIDGMTITIGRSGGAKPTIKFDDIQFEQTGESLEFRAVTPLGTRLHLTEVRLRIEDAFDSTLASNSMPEIPIDSFLGVAALTSGIVFRRVDKGVTLIQANIKNTGDFLSAGSELINVSGNATNTGYTLLIKFGFPVVLLGDDGSNFLSFTISDDLSGLTRFVALARGGRETT